MPPAHDQSRDEAIRNDHTARLDSMEATVESLIATTGKLQSSVATVTAAVSELHLAVKADRDQSLFNHNEVRSDIRLLGDKYNQTRTTNWPVLIGASAILLSVLSLIGGVIAFAIFTPNQITDRYQEASIDRNFVLLMELARSERENAIKESQNSKMIDVLKDALQRSSVQVP